MSYKEGIIKAIEEHNDRTGTSMVAIKKHMQANLASDKKWLNATFLAALKSGVASGDFVQVKGSYKLSADFKKKRAGALKPKTKPKKAAPKKKTAPKKTAPKKKTAVKKKTSTKKTASKKKTSTKKKTTAKKAVKKTSAKKTSAKKKAVKKSTSKKQ
eukprot:CAMPEP_0172494560 /NCGR_PEP_ID=MMETSP1066-20121228/51212_1 /TAXON_ID=671091 /ORGANISM="Coscinodiscus wailesii, Strain CCMP2513" /LENGTH=156 /DNA_ID=CAMNT_0013265631 /DNA_START=114 /DNA_END=584 /DNA_ORIENTATION=+